MVSRNFLEEYLNVWYHTPPLAYWRAIEAEMLSQVEFQPPVLDLGCGDGTFASVLFNGRASVDVGCDLSEGDARQARQHNVYGGVVVADGCALPFRDGVIGSVVSNCVLEHIPNQLGALHEIARVLRTGGRLICTVPSEKFEAFLYGYHAHARKGDMARADGYARRITETSAHFHYRSPAEWRSTLAEVGLSVCKSCYYMPENIEWFWDRLRHVFCDVSIWGSPLFVWLSGRKARWLLLHRVLPYLWHICLRRKFAQGTQASLHEGGGLFIVAEKIV